jgi:glucose/arabinose dehydrogenase
MKNIFITLFIAFFAVSCYQMRGTRGGGNSVDSNDSIRRINSADIALPAGYSIEAIATGLTFPSGVCVNDEGVVYVIESGYSYGEVWLEPAMYRIENGSAKLVSKGKMNGPWNGITFQNGYFYIAEGGQSEGGKILKLSQQGDITIIVDSLPSLGDHHTNGPLIVDGYIYFGQGTVTNSAVVGPDNSDFGWLSRHPEYHDIPCRDIKLAGVNYESTNPLTDAPDDKALTGAYVPFDSATSPGMVIKGSVPCSGAVLRVPINGGEPELVVWGLRNPYGLAKNSEGKIFVTENGFDDRGSRPVWGAGDVLWEIKPGSWYGWPDYSEGKPIANDEEFHPPGKDRVSSLLQEIPMNPPSPVAVFGVHSSSNGIDFSTSEQFGYKGDAFVAQFGDMAPKVGKVLAPVGFKVVRVNVTNGTIEDFAVNKGKINGPATYQKSGGLERPLAVKFDERNNALYITDFGIMHITDAGPKPYPKTGVVWKITKSKK